METWYSTTRDWLINYNLSAINNRVFQFYVLIIYSEYIIESIPAAFVLPVFSLPLYSESIDKSDIALYSHFCATCCIGTLSPIYANSLFPRYNKLLTNIHIFETMYTYAQNTRRLYSYSSRTGHFCMEYTYSKFGSAQY